MLKNNREKALVSLNIALIFFLVVAITIGGWPQAGSVADNSQVLRQAVANYYERMPDHVYKIPEAELKQLVDSNDPDIYILDIRDAKDYALGHIKGAHNIPFKEMGKSLEQLPLDKTIIVHCYTGQTAGQTVAALNIAGYKARSLNGGMNNGWAKQGYPVVQ